MLDEVLDHCEARHLALKVGVLDAGLDGIEGGGDGDRGDGTGNGGDKVLAPCCLRVVGHAEHVLLRRGRSAEELSNRENTR